MPDVFLYAGEPNPNDVRLRDPTSAAGAGEVTGELTATAPAPSAALAAAHGVAGTLAALVAAPSAGWAGAVGASGTLAASVPAPIGGFAGEEGVAGALAAVAPIPEAAIAGTAAAPAAPPQPVDPRWIGGWVPFRMERIRPRRLRAAPGPQGRRKRAAEGQVAALVPAPRAAIQGSIGAAATMSGNVPLPRARVEASHNVMSDQELLVLLSA